MCVENIYVDVYPDGKEVEFRKTSICQYGELSRPCPTLTTLENPPRHIQYGEISTQAMLTQSSFYPRTPQTPPRSSSGSQHRRSGSHHRNSGGYVSEDNHHRSRRNSGLAAAVNDRKFRQHRKERIIIVDSPPTPRTPPQLFSQVFTAPSSPATPPYIFDSHVGRGRPIIVDERPLRRERVDSRGAVVGHRSPGRPRSRSYSRPRHSSQAVPSFSERARRLEEEQRRGEEREERRRKRNEREEREAERVSERRLQERIAQQNAEILRRPAVPMPPPRLHERDFLRPVIQQSAKLQDLMADLTLDGAARRAEEGRRREERERLTRVRFEDEVQAREDEAMRQRLRERQMPRRRFSVGPGYRRHRVLYDDGVYRYE
ncbi:hypothetical protein BP6252_12715 [Coleophoma cylindrospora]|uniref:Uncharacterized protein n=1 Tax=Coleophoma cylindrospora TaxID=1849047 RepID=A0A3D8QDE1_9HELO|nr:hypothetical protein BP6252_12715 [Coleophoma cylindrospora]